MIGSLRRCGNTTCVADRIQEAGTVEPLAGRVGVAGLQDLLLGGALRRGVGQRKEPAAAWMMRRRLWAGGAAVADVVEETATPAFIVLNVWSAA